MKCMIAALFLSTLGLSVAYPALSGSSHASQHGPFEFMHGSLGDRHADAGGHLEGLATLLELTTEQRAEIANLLSETTVFADAKVLLSRHGVQVEAVHADRFNEELIREASAPVGAAQADVAVSLARLMHDAHAVLTDEQRALLTSLHPDLGARVHNHVAAFELALASWIEENR